MYSALLFIRTGHFAAPFLVHAYCNFMGFPDFVEVTIVTSARLDNTGLHWITLDNTGYHWITLDNTG